MRSDTAMRNMIGIADDTPTLVGVRPRAVAVSWGAVLAGAVVIAAVGLILLGLGAGFTLSAVSPWPSRGVSGTTFGVMTAIWLVVVQWLSSGIGGYLAGRLRTRPAGLHEDESYFRDTAHGLLAWAVAAVVGAAALTGAAGALTGSAATIAGGAAQGVAQSSPATAPGPYLVDTLFRSDRADIGTTDPRPEATRIIALGLRPGSDVSPPDRAYLARLVATRTGVSQDEATKRVDDTITEARAAADAARKTAATVSLYIGFSMLIGAFVAAVAGKIGGHHRDDLTAI